MHVSILLKIYEWSKNLLREDSNNIMIISQAFRVGPPVICVVHVFNFVATSVFRQNFSKKYFPLICKFKYILEFKTDLWQSFV
jgi:hypothetical protein